MGSGSVLTVIVAPLASLPGQEGLGARRRTGIAAAKASPDYRPRGGIMTHHNEKVNVKADKRTLAEVAKHDECFWDRGISTRG